MASTKNLVSLVKLQDVVKLFLLKFLVTRIIFFMGLFFILAFIFSGVISFSETATRELNYFTTRYKGLKNTAIFNRISTNESLNSCDLFDGSWVRDDNIKPYYLPGSCPFIDDAFNCFKNGRPDNDYLSFRWKPKSCTLPRLQGREMLMMLRGKRLVFVGDSLNRNMWESLVCILRDSLEDKNRVFEISGKKEFKTEGSYAFTFPDYNCSLEFVRSPFLVQEWGVSNTSMGIKQTLRLDMIHNSSSNYINADLIIFNSGHWWTHSITTQGKNYYQEGDYIHPELSAPEAYSKALRTWAKWVDSTIDRARTRVFFRGYSYSHFNGGLWHSRGSCDGERQPIVDEVRISEYPLMAKILESVIEEMKTHVFYLNITKMTSFRKDGHPSIFREKVVRKKTNQVADCSHWCLPGVPDSWNELLG